MQPFAYTPLVAAILATFVMPAHAQENQPADVDVAAAADQTTLPGMEVIGEPLENEYESDSSTIGGKVNTLVRDIPQTINIVNRAVMDAQAVSSIKDALRYVPGITISAGEGSQIGDNINLRGFSARTDVYLDGFRDRGQYSRDTFFLEAVEVLKGPSSMMFGRGSTGGVINQVSKAPSLRQFAEMSATAGTDDFYRTTVDVNQPISDTGALRIAAMGQDLRTTRDVVHNKGFGIAPSLRLGIGSPTEFTFSALTQKNDDIPDYGFPLLTGNGPGTIARPIDAREENFYGYEDDHFDQDVRAFNATVRHRFSDLLSIRNRTQYVDYDMAASPSPLTIPTGPATPTLAMPLASINLQRQDRDREVDDLSLSNQTDVVLKFGDKVKHTLVTGLEFGTDEYHNDGFSYARPTPPPDPTLVNLQDPEHGTRSGTRFLSSTADTEARTLAAYVNEQADIGDHVKVIAGVRWDHFEADSSATTVAQDGTITVPAQPLKRTDIMFSPRTGVIWQPSDTQSYYVSFGRSFNPSAEAVTQSSGTSAANASLSPEKNNSYELGAKWDLAGGDLSLTAALFRVEKTNARFNDPGLGGLQSLEGKVRVDGVELGALGRITDNWQVLGGYTWQSSEIVESPEIGSGNNAGIAAEGHRYPNTPTHSATLWTSYFFLQDFEVGGGAVYVGKRTLNNFETAEVDGYARGDLTAAFHQPIYDVRVNLQNVTDEFYFDTASGGRATPVRGRTVLLTGTLKFGGSS